MNVVDLVILMILVILLVMVNLKILDNLANLVNLVSLVILVNHLVITWGWGGGHAQCRPQRVDVLIIVIKVVMIKFTTLGHNRHNPKNHQDDCSL